MRLIAVLILGAVVYFGVPYLWQRAVMAEVNRVAETNAGMPVMVSGIPQSTFENGAALANALNPAIEINTEEYEAIAVRSQADQAMRQSQAASDQAWRATH